LTFDPLRFDALGAALDAACRAWSAETCLIESDRERDNARFTYSQFRSRGLELAGWLEREGVGADDRVAILLSNQSRWHLSAFAAFHRGAVLVPLDFKLAAPEHLALLAHSRAKVLVVEHHLWRAMSEAPRFDELACELVLVTDAPDGARLPAPPRSRLRRWEECRVSNAAPALVPRRREDVACIVYSSGTGGRPKGCLLTHGNYLAQFAALVELHPMRPGVVYLSILPTNHAIDFMVGFLGPYLCGAAVVHLRTLRPELVRDAFARYRITHVALVPLVLSNLEAGLRARFAALSPPARVVLGLGKTLHAVLGRGRPRPRVARRLLAPVHRAFGGRLEAVFVGGAWTDPATLRFFHGLGIPVANGYGLTEAGTAITLDRLDPPRPDTVGTPLPGIELRVEGAAADGVGEILVRGLTVMSGYLDDPELTAETIVDGWLHTGDVGFLDADGALHLVGRSKNMIVTAGGKNVYPEDVETSFEGIGAKEICIFAAHRLWKERRRDERLVLVARAEHDGLRELAARVAERNRALRDFQRVAGLIAWTRDFPRTASLKIRRIELARQVGEACDPERDVVRIR
jgi:long-chain acyl-CoA synthetase